MGVELCMELITHHWFKQSQTCRPGQALLCHVCVAGNDWLTLRVEMGYMYNRSFIPLFPLCDLVKGYVFRIRHNDLEIYSASLAS